MTAPYVDKRGESASLNVSAFPRNDTPIIDCSLPARFTELAPRARHFDVVARELRWVPLEGEFRRWICERLPERPITGGGRLSERLCEAIAVGTPLEPTPHRLLVVPEVARVAIPERSGAPEGILKRLEPWVDAGGVVVLFSSYDQDPQHHSQLWNYALGWPAHVELYCALADYRRNESLPPFDGDDRRLDLRWRYEHRVFEDRFGHEYWAHLLTAEPHRKDDRRGAGVTYESLLTDEYFKIKLRQVGEIGAQEALVAALTQFDEYRCGMRREVESVRELAARNGVAPVIVNDALNYCIPQRHLTVLRQSMSK